MSSALTSHPKSHSRSSPAGTVTSSGWPRAGPTVALPTCATSSSIATSVRKGSAAGCSPRSRHSLPNAMHTTSPFAHGPTTARTASTKSAAGSTTSAGLGSTAVSSCSYAATSESAELDRRVFAELGQSVAGVDAADGAGLGAHDEGLGGGAAGVVVDALQEFAVGDAGGGEEGIVAG